MVYSYSYKIGLVKTLLHRAFVISSNWSIFDLELGKTKELLENNLYLGNSINQQTKNTCMCNLVMKKINNLIILHLFHFTNSLMLEICRQKLNKKLSNTVNIIVKILMLYLCFRRLKLNIYLVSKNQYLRSFIISRFSCPGCSARYIGEITCYLTTRTKLVLSWN